MLWTETDIALPEEKIKATSGSFISLPGNSRFYEYAIPALDQFDCLSLLCRSSANAELHVSFFGRPDQDGLHVTTTLPPGMIRSLLLPVLQLTSRVYFECPATLDILAFRGLNLAKGRQFAPAKFNYRVAAYGKQPHFNKKSLLLPSGVTEVTVTADSIFNLTSPREVCDLTLGDVRAGIRGTVSFFCPQDAKSFLLSCEQPVEFAPYVITDPFVPQANVASLRVRNEYGNVYNR